MAETREFCYVAKSPCGHYNAAVTADPDDIELTAQTIADWKKAGLTVEQKPVSFVRSGGLAFCNCAAATGKAG